MIVLIGVIGELSMEFECEMEIMVWIAAGVPEELVIDWEETPRLGCSLDRSYRRRRNCHHSGD